MPVPSGCSASTPLPDGPHQQRPAQAEQQRAARFRHGADGDPVGQEHGVQILAVVVRRSRLVAVGQIAGANVGRRRYRDFRRSQCRQTGVPQDLPDGDEPTATRSLFI